MGASNFNDDYGTGTVVANGFTVKSPTTGVETPVITATGASSATRVSLSSTVGGTTTAFVAFDRFQLPVFTLAQTNALATPAVGQMVFVSNGNAGAPTVAVYSAGTWKVVAIGATIS